MKTVVLNGSSNPENGNTSSILKSFERGMQDAGAEIKSFPTEQLKIKRCHRCKKCIYKTPGKCYQKDDMRVVLPILSQSEVWVFATSHPSDGLPDRMKRLVDRLLPLTKIMGDFNKTDGSRGGNVSGKVALISSSESSELGQFNSLVQQIQTIARTYGREFAGALICPQIRGVRTQMEGDGLPNDVISAAYEAGRQLVQTGSLRPETLVTVSQEIKSGEALATTTNLGMQRVATRAYITGYWTHSNHAR